MDSEMYSLTTILKDAYGNSLLCCISSVFQDEDASTKKWNESSIKPDKRDACDFGCSLGYVLVLLSPVIALKGQLEPELNKGIISRSDLVGIHVLFMPLDNQSRGAKVQDQL